MISITITGLAQKRFDITQTSFSAFLRHVYMCCRPLNNSIGWCRNCRSQSARTTTTIVFRTYFRSPDHPIPQKRASALWRYFYSLKYCHVLLMPDFRSFQSHLMQPYPLHGTENIAVSFFSHLMQTPNFRILPREENCWENCWDNWTLVYERCSRPQRTPSYAKCRGSGA